MRFSTFLSLLMVLFAVGYFVFKGVILLTGNAYAAMCFGFATAFVTTLLAVATTGILQIAQLLLEKKHS